MTTVKRVEYYTQICIENENFFQLAHNDQGFLLY